jgi:hypothetical protein
MRPFTHSDLDADLLTTEHVPPKSLGGRRLVLTCRSCNTRAGTEVDSQMLHLEQMYDFAQGTMTRRARARLEIGGEALNVELLASGSGIQLVGVPRANDPRGQARAEAELERLARDQQWDGYQFRITSYQRFRGRAALVGWLRAAYLAAFAALGYRYIVRPELQIVRAQLADTTAEILPVFSMTMPAARRAERRLLLVEQPSWLRSLCVQMGRHAVFLPGLSAARGLYDRLARRSGRNRHAELQLTGKLVPWPTKPELALDFP